MRKSLVFMIGLALLGMAFVATPVRAMAQDDSGNKKISQIELDQADVRDALKILFKQVGYNYSVDPQVQGLVTVHLKDVDFESALRNVLNQVEATYRLEAGIYTIFPKPKPTDNEGQLDKPTAPTPTMAPRKIKFKHIDPMLLALLLGANTYVSDEPEPLLDPVGGNGNGNGNGNNNGYGGNNSNNGYGGNSGFNSGGYGNSGYGGGGNGGTHR